jgi:hypothetical protein
MQVEEDVCLSRGAKGLKKVVCGFLLDRGEGDFVAGLMAVVTPKGDKEEIIDNRGIIPRALIVRERHPLGVNTATKWGL